MENGFASPRSDSFPVGLRVLVVDDDPTWLKILEKMLKKCSYEVTTCSLARDALDKLRQRKHGFDIVISDVNMPDMDGFKLLEHVGLEMNLPVIMMSVDGETSRVMKGVQHGACDYLLKPIRMKELQNIWQHVLRKKIHEVKDIESHDDNDDFQGLRNRFDEFDDGHLLTGGDDLVSAKKRKDMETQDQDEQDFNESSAAKKARVVWSVDLHQKFVNAVKQIGLDKVGPKKVLDLMNVPWLTRENVASHLQKYRLYLSRLQKQNEPNSSFGMIKQPDITSKDSPANFDLQNLIMVHQNNASSRSFEYSGNKILLEDIGPEDQGDLKSIISFGSVTKPQKNLTGDVSYSRKVSNGPQVAISHSSGSLRPDVKFSSFGSAVAQQHSWSKDIPEMQISRQPKQENELLINTHNRMPSPQYLDKRAKMQPPDIVNTEAFGVISSNSYDQNYSNKWEIQEQENISSSRSTSVSSEEDLQFCSIEDFGYIDNVALHNLEFFDFSDPDLTNNFPNHIYSGVRFNSESMESPIVDHGLFMA
ncbi:hypothetical protein GIB67_018762 [Kingdonia uniflora]|uniref:Two-component response regulator n=1 Tax=Kingdonia uniflora TaxID=39325 RepID=A0A7J7NEM1_9MAGN|nr:hypothetical protein GIB67_018762 [Kingdonia uniflora]